MNSILIVDDDPRARQRLVSQVARIGSANVIECEVVEDAVESIHDDLTLAILDLSLPIRRGETPTAEAGIQIAQALHKRSIPFIIISAIAHDPHLQEQLLSSWPLSLSDKALSDEALTGLIRVSERQAKKLIRLRSAADRAAIESLAAGILSCRLSISNVAAKKVVAGFPQTERQSNCRQIAETNDRLLALEAERLKLQRELKTVEKSISLDIEHLAKLAR